MQGKRDGVDARKDIKIRRDDHRTVAKHDTRLTAQKHVVLKRVVLGTIHHHRVEGAVEEHVSMNARAFCCNALPHAPGKPTSSNSCGERHVDSFKDAVGDFEAHNNRCWTRRTGSLNDSMRANGEVSRR